MPGPAGVGIDLRHYNDRAQKGAVSVQRLGPKSFQMIVRNYDPANGTELEPAVVPINVEGLDASIEQTEAQIKELQAAKESLEKLKADMAGMDANNLSIFTAGKATE